MPVPDTVPPRPVEQMRRVGHALHAADDGGADAAGAQGAWGNMAAFMPGPHILLTIVRPTDIGGTAPRARSAGGRRWRLPRSTHFSRCGQAARSQARLHPVATPLWAVERLSLGSTLSRLGPRLRTLARRRGRPAPHRL